MIESMTHLIHVRHISLLLSSADRSLYCQFAEHGISPCLGIRHFIYMFTYYDREKRERGRGRERVGDGGGGAAGILLNQLEGKAYVAKHDECEPIVSLHHTIYQS